MKFSILLLIFLISKEILIYDFDIVPLTEITCLSRTGGERARCLHWISWHISIRITTCGHRITQANLLLHKENDFCEANRLHRGGKDFEIRIHPHHHYSWAITQRISSFLQRHFEFPWFYPRFHEFQRFSIYQNIRKQFAGKNNYIPYLFC